MNAAKRPEFAQRTIALAGNPNVGKSTLFNLLTGSQQKIANYAGVTVEKKIGSYLYAGADNNIQIVDLPGIYSLNTKSEDEEIAKKTILGKIQNLGVPDAILVVIEASRLDRGLLLFKQIQQIHPQAILVLNMMDELKQEGTEIDHKKLSQLLDAPVIPMIAKTKFGFEELKNQIANTKALDTKKENIQNLQANAKLDSIYLDIDKIVAKVLTKKETQKSDFTEKLDRFFLNPVFGPITFLAIMLLMFQALFSWADPFIGMIEDSIGLLSDGLGQVLPESALKSFVIDGIIAGVGSVVVFVPQIVITFILVGFLEMTGYLSRGAFLIDRLMKMVGLEGRAFIPLLSSFACAIPGIAATRTIPDKKQRFITILIAPLMTCSARLPVYTLLIAAFVPSTAFFGFNLQGITLFGLFLFAIVTAMGVSFVLNKLLKSKTQGTFFIEMPKYRLPSFKNLFFYVWIRTKSFLISAGTVIFVLSMVLWAMAYYPRSESVIQKYQTQIELVEKQNLDDAKKQELIQNLQNQESGELIRQSFLGHIGRAIEPVIEPLGFDWKIGVGLLSAFAAREVFVSTMGIVFNLGETDEESDSLRELLVNSKKPNGDPKYNLATALSLLVFFALACQCTSTLGIVKRETNSYKWTAFVFVYMTVLAYVMAFIAYRIGLLLIG